VSRRCATAVRLEVTAGARGRLAYNRSMETVDAVVVGAGVVGLAVARALALAGREVLVLEAEESFGTQTSSRNSEVIHAGIYYPEGSLKARLCVAGKDLLYRYCAERGVAHRRIGKILVACDASELPVLATYARKAAANGVVLEPLDAAAVARMEPAVRAVAGLWSESTGIVDSHGLMLALLGDAQAAGATLVTHTPVSHGQAVDGGIVLHTGGSDPMALRCSLLVNSAGLGAQRLARAIAGMPEALVPPAFYAKGHYFTLSGRSPFSHLVYPMPDHAGLGIHVTLDLGGQCKFGPDVTRWPQAPDFAFEDGLEAKFRGAIRRYWPDLPEGALQPGYTGVRPKVSGPTEPAGDFVLQGPAVHGVPGLVNLFGIESPGLTSSLAIAREVLALAGIARDPAPC
jgi:L-2-hydroxyglutarate oxidase LhgO